MIVRVRRPIPYSNKRLAWAVDVEGWADVPLQRVMPSRRLRTAAGSDPEFYCEADISIDGKWSLIRRVPGDDRACRNPVESEKPA